MDLTNKQYAEIKQKSESERARLVAGGLCHLCGTETESSRLNILNGNALCGDCWKDENFRLYGIRC